MQSLPLKWVRLIRFYFRFWLEPPLIIYNKIKDITRDAIFLLDLIIDKDKETSILEQLVEVQLQYSNFHFNQRSFLLYNIWMDHCVNMINSIQTNWEFRTGHIHE